MTAQPNTSLAVAFLRRLDPDDDAFTLQTIAEAPDAPDGLTKVHNQVSLANGALDKLAYLNEVGAGVFFTANKTDGKGRQASNIIRVRALFVDLDGAPLEPVLEAGLKPHMVVQTSPGRYHVFWLVSDCPLDQFERVQRGLAALFGGDPSVHDLPRVMRLPGFVHHKGEPFLSHEMPEHRYDGPPRSLDEIVGTLKLDLDAAQARRGSAPQLTPDGKIGQGGRNAHLFANARSMAKRGMSSDAVYAALAAENETRCAPPLPDERVHYVANRAFEAKDAPDWEGTGRAPGRSEGGGGVMAPGTREIALEAKLLPLKWAHEAEAMLDVSSVVKGIIASGELAVIYGQPKSGKTFAAIDLSLSVASGREWFGHRVRQGLVFYLASEMGPRIMRRVRAWWDGRLAPLGQRIPFVCVPQAVNLLDSAAVDRLVATVESLIAERGVPALIVVDTLARSMVGGDENSAQDMGRAIAVGDMLRDRFGSEMLIVHHEGKSNGSARGSSALLGAADTMLRVESDPTGARVIEVEWCRDGAAGERIGFRLLPVDLGTDTDGDHVSTCIIEPADAPSQRAKRPRRDVALDALHEAISEFGQEMPGTSTIPHGVRAVKLDQWKMRWILRTGYEGSDDRSIRTNFDKDRRALLAAGAIGVSAPFVWALQ
jgi:hypothetical protein